MAPVSRCDLRLPCTPKPSGAKSVDATTTGQQQDLSAKSKTSDSSSTKAKLSDPNAGSRSSSASRSKSSDQGIPLTGTGSSSVSHKYKKSGPPLTGTGSSSVSHKYRKSDPPATGMGSTSVSHKYKINEQVEPAKGSSSVPAEYKLSDTGIESTRMGKSQEFTDDMGVDVEKSDDRDLDAENVPESAHDEKTRDSAEVLEGDSEFSTQVTRDSYEAEQHAGHKIGGEEDLDACEILRRLKAEVEEATAAGECEQMACPTLEHIGTPGDVCSQFCHDRMDSPKSVAELELAASQGRNKYCAKWSKKKGRVECDMRLGPRKLGSSKPEVICKGTYKTEETYTSLWGSSKAMDYRKRLESQMKKKRNLLEKMHHKEFLRRQKMRRRAKEKRRALKQRDPSKIATGNDNLRINKSYDLRVNYNKQLPTMPGTMQQHFDKFKKPPFKTYVTGQKVCTKRIDEFEKLRVPEKQKK